MCVSVCNVLMLFVCREVGQAGCVSSPSARSLPTPTHNHPPQNYGFVVDDQPDSLMHLKFVCLCGYVCLHAFEHGRSPLTNSVSAACP